VWVSHIAKNGHIFVREGIEADVGQRILQFITDHKNDLRELSIRTLLKACQLAKTQPDDWEPIAEVLLCK
jgi:ABC-type phosphate/phosphonate transport system substrate-binding protein